MCFVGLYQKHTRSQLNYHLTANYNYKVTKTFRFVPLTSSDFGIMVRSVQISPGLTKCYLRVEILKSLHLHSPFSQINVTLTIMIKLGVNQVYVIWCILKLCKCLISANITKE